MSARTWRPATPLCEHWGHAPGEWKYSCCACTGMPGGCVHCETDWDGNLLYPDGVIPPAALTQAPADASEGASGAVVGDGGGL